LGTYHKLPKQLKFLGTGEKVETIKEAQLNFNRIKYWISQGFLLIKKLGVKITPGVMRLLCDAGILPPQPVTPPKGYDRDLWRKEFKKAQKYFKEVKQWEEKYE
jgi:ribosomal protein S16